MLPTSLVCVALLASVASAVLLTESQLSCSPAEVEPGVNITCYIYVRDEVLEPTAVFATSDFTVRALTEIPEANAKVFPVERTVDPTVARFAVSSSTGTNIRVDVMTAGKYIRGSGFVGTILTWPPTRIGALSCTSQTLQLRQSVSCSAQVFGQNDVPAVARASDVYFSEDHSEGSFQFLSGMRSLIFNFTAPNYPSMRFTSFVLRVTLSGSQQGANVSLPLVYPSLKPTTRSSLQCVGEDTRMCIVNAADDIGPVVLNIKDYSVRVEEHAGDKLWVDVTNTMDIRWSSRDSVASMQLDVVPKNDVKVFNARMIVALKDTAEEVSISGSPFTYRCGVPPTPDGVSFKRCDRVYITGLNSTKCVLDISPDVTADPRYVDVTVSENGGDVSSLVYSSVNGTKRKWVFTFTAADVRRREDVFISVRAGGREVMNSPWQEVVYPRPRGVIDTEVANTRPPKIALGFLFYGAIFTIGGVLFCKRQRRIARVKQMKRKKAMEEDNIELERTEDAPEVSSPNDKLGASTDTAPPQSPAEPTKQ